jgi:acetyltransferase-like isoleucine patch superfamily enzyme
MSHEFYAHPTSIVSKEARIGKGTKIWHHAQVREGAEIGENCILGKCAYVGESVHIGNGVKVQNRASIYRGVRIEDDVLVGPHVVFTNDMYPRAFTGDWEVVPTVVERGASIGANSTIICGITIGQYAMVGAGSVVTRDVGPQVLVRGNPARPSAYVCRCGRPLARIEEVLPADGILRCDACGAENRLTVDRPAKG